MARADFAFCTRIRVRYAEIDAQAVVFNSRYLEFADVAITEYWRAVGFRSAGAAWAALEFHVARALVEFKAPIRYDEEIDLYARTTRIGRSSLTTWIEIHGAAQGPADDLRATVEIVNVNVDLASGTSCRLPDWIGETFTRFDAG
ncbi:MAG: thioesterase family protein [Pseudomonadota bacterium]